jgi:hypothetical protein
MRVRFSISLIIPQVPNPRVKTAQTSTSLDRAPASSKDFVRGQLGNLPFWPGGLEESLAIASGDTSGKPGLRTIPPGFSRGLRLPEDEIVDEELVNELPTAKSTVATEVSICLFLFLFSLAIFVKPMSIHTDL